MKILTLTFVNNARTAASLGMLAAIAGFTLSVAEALPLTLAPRIRCPWCALLGAFVYIACLLFWRRSSKVFLDIICINQEDVSFKKAALTSMAAILKQSEALLVVWDATWDARLRDIEPLRTTLKRVWHRGKDGSQKESSEKEADEADESKIFDWVLNRLRPVSYVPTRDEAHGRRFGFIAQDLRELEEVFPEMVRDLNLPSADHKTVHLLDLIALVDKSASERLHALEKRLARVEELEARVEHLEKTVATFLSAGSPPASPDTPNQHCQVWHCEVSSTEGSSGSNAGKRDITDSEGDVAQGCWLGF
eukprot:s1141_g5.t1